MGCLSWYTTICLHEWLMGFNPIMGIHQYAMSDEGNVPPSLVYRRHPEQATHVLTAAKSPKNHDRHSKRRTGCDIYNLKVSLKSLQAGIHW